MAHFTTHPLEYFTGEQQDETIAALNDYRGKTGFHFDRLIGDTDPNRITPQDIVAVSIPIQFLPLKDVDRRILAKFSVRSEMTEAGRRSLRS